MNQEQKIIEGKAIAKEIENELITAGSDLFKQSKLKPKISVVVLGQEPASQFYVRMIEKTCRKVFFDFDKYQLTEDIKQNELISLIKKLNNDINTHGIIVQTPLPPQIDEIKIRECLHPDKDVDCFNPVNMGKLIMGNPTFLPCTPNAVFEILKRENIKINGKNVVIIGRSSVVGKPLALIFLLKKPDANATVTVCHSRTENLSFYTKSADVIVVAAGRARLIKSDMISDNAVIIDVGTNDIDGKLVGDVDFDEVSKIARRITPVPGGVGPVTNMLLMKNTLQAARIQLSKSV